MKEPLVAGARLDAQRAARIANLPRWAQQYTAGLERTIAELEARVAVLSEGPDESDTFVDGLNVYPDRELGRGAVIGFRLTGGVIEAICRGEYLEIRSHDGALVAQPQSGNVLRIRSGEWW